MSRAKKEIEDRKMDLPGGGWVRLRPMTGQDVRDLARADKDPGLIIDAIERAVTEHSFGGLIVEQPWKTMREILAVWNRIDEEEALPPDNGES